MEFLGTIMGDSYLKFSSSVFIVNLLQQIVTHIGLFKAVCLEDVVICEC